MIRVLFIPFIIQALAIIFDEFYFHRKRGLPSWEKIGHPLDTLSVVLCLGYTVFFPFNAFHLKIYIALGVISLLMITKDEFIHKDICPKKEMWLHALLFINHPLLLISSALLWATAYGSLSIFSLTDPFLIFIFLKSQGGFSLAFGIYQLIYWNFIYKSKPINFHETESQ